MMGPRSPAWRPARHSVEGAFLERTRLHCRPRRQSAVEGGLLSRPRPRCQPIPSRAPSLSDLDYIVGAADNPSPSATARTRSSVCSVARRPAKEHRVRPLAFSGTLFSQGGFLLDNSASGGQNIRGQGRQGRFGHVPSQASIMRRVSRATSAVACRSRSDCLRLAAQVENCQRESYDDK